MRKIYIALLATLLATTAASAQVSVETAQKQEELKFNDQVKTEEQKPEFKSEAQLRAERAAIRKERNTIEFSAALNGSLSHFNSHWRNVNGNSNSITAIANIIFTHTYKKDLFNIDTKVTGKIGYTAKGLLRGQETDITKSQDEWFLSTAPAYKMSKNWNLSAIVSLRSQFANGFNDSDDVTSQFFSPAYFNISVGFTYVCPKPKFPIKVNLSPISMNSTFVTSTRVKEHFFNTKAFKSTVDGTTPVTYAEYMADHSLLSAADRNTAYAYGLSPNNGSQRYEGGSSIQIDFDRTFGKKGIFRYRTTLYSFYGWINELVQQSPKNRGLYEHLAPNVRWENTIDIKATKYFSTQLYFQLYYNKAQSASVQTQTILGVGLSYTFKNK